MLSPTQHYLVSIRLTRKISFVTSFTISKWLKKYYFQVCFWLSLKDKRLMVKPRVKLVKEHPDPALHHRFLVCQLKDSLLVYLQALIVTIHNINFFSYFFKNFFSYLYKFFLLLLYKHFLLFLFKLFLLFLYKLFLLFLYKLFLLFLYKLFLLLLYKLFLLFLYKLFLLFLCKHFLLFLCKLFLLFLYKLFLLFL